jgi:hypothetical protein
MEKLKDFKELKGIKMPFDRKRAGILFKRLLTEYHKHKMSLIFNDKKKITGFYTIDVKTGKPLKHKLFIRHDKLMCTCNKFGKQAFDMDIYIPSINKVDHE